MQIEVTQRSENTRTRNKGSGNEMTQDNGMNGKEEKQNTKPTKK